VQSSLEPQRTPACPFRQIPGRHAAVIGGYAGCTARGPNTLDIARRADGGLETMEHWALTLTFVPVSGPKGRCK